MTSWHRWEEVHAALCAAPEFVRTKEVDLAGHVIWARITSSGSVWLVASYVPDVGIAFGWCLLSDGSSSWGITSMDDLMELDIEIDPDFEPKRFGDLNLGRT